MVLSAMVNAPLLNRADPDTTPNPSKAPWYFLNLQELLLHMEPAWAGVIVPTIALVLLAAIPYWDRDQEGQGVWFGPEQRLQLAGRAGLVPQPARLRYRHSLGFLRLHHRWLHDVRGLARDPLGHPRNHH